jgi:hexosaminidase
MDWESTDTIRAPHGGFYTQEEIKEIIAYAANLNITIIPEIGMPGHVSAAIVAYPYLGTITKPVEVPTNFAVKEGIYNISDPRVMEFIHDVLTEVMDLFPATTIHIGGDEAKYNDWQKSVEMQAYMKEKGLDTPSEMQVLFNNELPVLSGTTKMIVIILLTIRECFVVGVWIIICS